MSFDNANKKFEYVLSVEKGNRTPEEVEADLKLLDSFMEPVSVTTELESLGPDWTDYTDLGLKALLVIAAFAIYFRL